MRNSLFFQSVAAGLCSLYVLSHGFTLNDLNDVESTRQGADTNNGGDEETLSVVEDLFLEADHNNDHSTTTPHLMHGHLERNKCCFRHSHYKNVGFDLSGNDHIVDVGICRRKCMRRRPLDEINASQHPNQTENVRDDEQQLSGAIFAKEPACNLKDLCEPVKVVIERHHLFGGSKDVEVIEECECLSHPISCQRVARKILIFQDTPFEKEIDVGMCRGPCDESEKSCVPVRNRTISILGSNGAQCIEVIDECACGKACYRMHYNETYLEALWDEETNTTVSRRKEIDVGRCAGHCPDSDRYKCVLRDETKEESCLMALTTGESRCSGNAFTSHSFVTPKGKRRTVLSIDECSCN